MNRGVLLIDNIVQSMSCTTLHYSGLSSGEGTSITARDWSLITAVEQCSTECRVVNCIVVGWFQVQCSAQGCSAVQCSAVQCSTVQCSAVQCSAVQSVIPVMSNLISSCVKWCSKYTPLNCTALHNTTLQCTAVHYTALHCTALHCSVKCTRGLVWHEQQLQHPPPAPVNS